MTITWARAIDPSMIKMLTAWRRGAFFDRGQNVRPRVWPLLAGWGAAPQSIAKAASLRIRSGLSPAVTKNWPAISAATPKRSASWGAVCSTRVLNCYGI